MEMTSFTSTSAIGGEPAPSPSSADADAAFASQPSEAEVKRIRLRRRLARKSPEQRRKRQQYQRRHNEKDERLYYCDYCDLFISTRHKTWLTHLRSARHLDAFKAYYDLAAHVESVWLGEIQRDVDLARSREVYRRQQMVAGTGASTPLAAQRIAAGIVIGGIPAPRPPPIPPAQPVLADPVRPPPSIRVGTKTIEPMSARSSSAATQS